MAAEQTAVSKRERVGRRSSKTPADGRRDLRPGGLRGPGPGAGRRGLVHGGASGAITAISQHWHSRRAGPLTGLFLSPGNTGQPKCNMRTCRSGGAGIQTGAGVLDTGSRPGMTLVSEREAV